MTSQDQEAKEIVAVAVDAFCKTVGHKGTNAAIEAAVNAAAPLIIKRHYDERRFLAAHAGEDEVHKIADALASCTDTRAIPAEYGALIRVPFLLVVQAIRILRAIPRTHSCAEEETSTIPAGTRVLKFTGDYQLEGEVRASLYTKNGNLRYVVEHDAGFLHIYGPSNIKPIPAAPHATEKEKVKE